MTMNTPTLAIVVPCYNESAVINQTDSALGRVMESLLKKGKIDEESFILYVDDGSKDNTWEKIELLVRTEQNRQGLKLSRNFGHQSALMAGLNQIRNSVDCCITIDADLQDDEWVIEKMVEKYTNGYEIVYGVREKRDSDTFIKKYTAIFFYKLMKGMGVELILNHADYRLAGRKALDNLFLFKEVNLFLRGVFPLLGFPGTSVFYDRKKRMAGESKYPFGKMLGLALDGITSFSVKPLKMVTFFGFIVFFISIILAFYALYSYLYLGTVPGWTSITLPIYFISGIQILCIGILGEYLGKIYKEVKSRPLFIVENHIRNSDLANK